MEMQSLINLGIILLFSASIFYEGYMDGYNLVKKKMLHGLKLITIGGLIAGLYIWGITDHNPYLPLLYLLLRLPLMTIAVTKGMKLKQAYYFGDTSLTDKIIKMMKLDYIEEHKFPIIGVIFSLMIFFAITLAIELGK